MVLNKWRARRQSVKETKNQEQELRALHLRMLEEDKMQQQQQQQQQTVPQYVVVAKNGRSGNMLEQHSESTQNVR